MQVHLSSVGDNSGTLFYVTSPAQETLGVFTLGDVDFNFICLNGTFDVDVKI